MLRGDERRADIDEALRCDIAILLSSRRRSPTLQRAAGARPPRRHTIRATPCFVTCAQVRLQRRPAISPLMPAGEFTPVAHFRRHNAGFHAAYFAAFSTSIPAFQSFYHSRRLEHIFGHDAFRQRRRVYCLSPSIASRGAGHTPIRTPPSPRHAAPFRIVSASH